MRIPPTDGLARFSIHIENRYRPIDKYINMRTIRGMFRQEDVVIERPFEFVYRASLPIMELTGYGFSKKQALELLELRYNQYLDSFLEKRDNQSQISVNEEQPVLSSETSSNPASPRF
jgi:hypothetical protein